MLVGLLTVAAAACGGPGPTATAPPPEGLPDPPQTTTQAAGPEATTATPASTATPTAAPIPTPSPAVAVVPTATPTAMPVPTIAPTLTPSPAAHPSAVPVIPDILPRGVFFTLPNKADVMLSPDGSRISFRAPVCGFSGCYMNLWVAPSDDLSLARPVTQDLMHGVHGYVWSFTNNHLLYWRDTDGDENWQIFSVNVTTQETTGLTPSTGVQANLNEVSHKFPEEVLVEINDRDPELHDLYRINILDGARSLVLRNEGFFDFVVDREFNVRIAMQFKPDGGTELLGPLPQGGWESLAAIDMQDSLTTFPLGFDETGAVLFMADSRDRNTAALVKINMDTQERTVAAADPRADVDDVLLQPATGLPQAAAFIFQRKEWQIIDESIGPDLAYLSALADGDFEIASQTLDNKRWIVAFTIDTGPRRFYLHDRDAREARFLFAEQDSLEGLPLANMRPVVIKSRDGLDLVSYLTLPPWTDSDTDGLPDKPLAMVLLIHGGPWARDEWGYQMEHQLLSNRGYAVLSVNFRGSTGFGKDFLNAANGEYAGKMHEDLIDAVDWAIEEGIADSKRIAIMGYSYGGYAVLVGLTFTPGVFACGVEFAGPSNLITDLESIPPYLEPVIELFATRVGDHRTEEGRAVLLQRSPLTFVDRISKPLLIAHGANDPRVKEAESAQIVKAMQEKGIPVTYLLYPDEGHGFASATNAQSFIAVAEAFLAQCLGGRYQPMSYELFGSSVTVPAGAEQVPGLESAISQLSSGDSR